MPFIGNTPAAVPLTSADIADGIITSAKIVDGTIVNADINASAAIASTKLSGVGITLGTSVASTSGTSIDFTGLPSTAKRITVMFSAVSLSGTSSLRVRLGTSSGFETSGYAGSSLGTAATSLAVTSFSSGIDYNDGGSASNSRSGTLTFTLIGSNNWTFNGMNGYTDTNRTAYVAGNKSLSNVITQIRITTVNGTDTFDAGSINIMYE